MFYDDGKIQVWRGVTGWCFVVTTDGKKFGGIGYASEESALRAARNKF
jgi:hypothetical protein